VCDVVSQYDNQLILDRLRAPHVAERFHVRIEQDDAVDVRFAPSFADSYLAGFGA